MRIPIYLCLFFLITTSCINRGTYRYGGTFAGVQLPAASKRVAFLDPRGPFGDEDARKLLHKHMFRAFGRCGVTATLTEDELNEMGQLPAIYGQGLSEANLDWFATQSDLDYLVFTDIGPGYFKGEADNPGFISADREASVLMVVYDIKNGGELKSVSVNGRLDLLNDRRIWQLQASEETMAVTALGKAVRRLGKLTDCG